VRIIEADKINSEFKKNKFNSFHVNFNFKFFAHEQIHKIVGCLFHLSLSLSPSLSKEHFSSFFNRSFLLIFRDMHAHTANIPSRLLARYVMLVPRK
jgi:hypothetical protein